MGKSRKMYCNICGARFEESELVSSKGTCPIEFCEGIEDDIHSLEKEVNNGKAK